jgi:inner membrane protease ATP23
MATDSSNPPPTAPGSRPTISPSNPDNDPSKTGYDPSKKWSNIFSILTDRMTPEGKEAFREDAYIRNEARDCANCDKWKDYLFTYSPMVVFMQKRIAELNGDLGKDKVHCRRCPTRRVVGEDGKVTSVRQGGGFSPDHGILICANEMRDKGHMEDTLAHEMVHAWDHLRWKVDWSDLRHAACTEVRSIQSP